MIQADVQHDTSHAMKLSNPLFSPKSFKDVPDNTLASPEYYRSALVDRPLTFTFKSLLNVCAAYTRWRAVSYVYPDRGADRESCRTCANAQPQRKGSPGRNAPFLGRGKERLTSYRHISVQTLIVSPGPKPERVTDATKS